MSGKERYTMNASKCGDEEMVLKSLLDAFGSSFSHNEIASAYFKAGYDADLAGEMLYQMQGSTSRSASNGEVGNGDNSGKISEKSYQANGNSKTSKSKSQPCSAGTVSSVIGKGYARSKPSANQFTEISKPLKVNVKFWREISGEGDCTSSGGDFQLHQDMEDFLFKMLGDGFGLNREVIRDVLGSCGYDMKKSMENLLNLPKTPGDKRLSLENESADMPLALSSSSDSISEPNTCCSGGNENMASSKKGLELTNLQKIRIDLQKEVLTSLFNASEEPLEEELPRRIVSRVKRSRAFGQVVSEPLKDMDAEYERRLEFKEQNTLDVENEEKYQHLRKAVREYRGTMKEYYATAIDAYAKGDSLRASKLIEKGHFFHQKAQEADEESSQLIFEPRNSDTQDEILLDLHDLDAKVAVGILKSQISSLSGIPSIKHLKVIIEVNDKNTSKRSCRRLVKKLLEKESIEWAEEENGGSILIRLDTINRKRLSFVKKMH